MRLNGQLSSILQPNSGVNIVSNGNQSKSMTEREKNEICKGYADLIIRKEQITRELWKTEFAIKKLEDVLIRNKILIPTEAEETSETDQAT